MPVHSCQSGSKSGFQWGDSGKCYTGPGAKSKAEKQAAAIHSSGYSEKHPNHNKVRK